VRCEWDEGAFVRGTGRVMGWMLEGVRFEGKIQCIRISKFLLTLGFLLRTIKLETKYPENP